VTAFAAFHWFGDKKSVSEIKRVLKPDGIFFTANRSGTKDWGGGYRQVITRSIKKPVAQFQIKYNSEKTMRESRFKKVKVKKWKQSEIYSLPQALDYVQSVSIWNSVPIGLRSKALEGLKEYIQDIKRKHGKIVRWVSIKVVTGVKNL